MKAHRTRPPRTSSRLHKRLISEGFPIEEGFEVLAKEVPVPGAKIDILGKDGTGQLCLVELKVRARHRIANTGFNTARRQLKAGGAGLNKVLEVLGIGQRVSFRYIYVWARQNTFDDGERFDTHSWANEEELDRTA